LEYFSFIYSFQLCCNDLSISHFFNILDKKIISDIEVEEGDLITFPAYIIHRSNTNSENKKTIISFNSSFETIDEKKVDKLL